MCVCVCLFQSPDESTRTKDNIKDEETDPLEVSKNY